MSLEGMDVDRAQRLAGQFKAHAQALADIAAGLTALAAELGRTWLGPASATFQQQWTTHHHAALNSAAQALTEMHTRVMVNIQQQIHASTAESRSTAGDVVAGLGTTLDTARRMLRIGWEAAERADHYVLDPLEKLEDVVGNKWVTGRYDRSWTKLLNLDRDSSFLKYKSSPVLHWLHDNPLMQKAGRVLDDTHASEVLEKADRVGKGLGLITVGTDVGHTRAAWQQHHYTAAGGDLVDATADGLKDTKDPVLYLAGVAIAINKEAYDDGSQVFHKGYIPSSESPVDQVVGQVGKAFL